MFLLDEEGELVDRREGQCTVVNGKASAQSEATFHLGKP